jgi:hypothetical protein
MKSFGKVAGYKINILKSVDFYIFQQQTDWEWNKGNNLIYNSLKNNEVPWSK